METQSRVNAISKVKVDVLNRDAIVAELNRLNAKFDNDDNSEALSVRLYVAYQATDTEQWGKCDVCGGKSDPSLSACPYCGTSDETPAESVATQPAPAPEAPQVPDKPAPEPVPFGTAVAGETPEATDGMGFDGAATTIDASAMDPAVIATEEPKKKRARKAKAPAAAPSALMGSPIKSAVVDSTQLDAAVARILELKRDEAGNKWRLGREILDVYSKRLWTTRVREDGTAAYKTFEAFCANEIHLTASYASLVMDVSQYYSEEEVRSWGVRKLVETMKVPEEARQYILEQKVKKGASLREVIKDVQQVKANENLSDRASLGERVAGTSSTGNQRKSKAARKREGRASSRRATAVKLTNLVGSQKVKAFAKPADIADFDVSTAKRAKRLHDVPFARRELCDGVMEYVSLVDTPQGLEFQFKVVLTEKK